MCQYGLCGGTEWWSNTSHPFHERRAGEDAVGQDADIGQWIRGTVAAHRPIESYVGAEEWGAPATHRARPAGARGRAGCSRGSAFHKPKHPAPEVTAPLGR